MFSLFFRPDERAESYTGRDRAAESCGCMCSVPACHRACLFVAMSCLLAMEDVAMCTVFWPPIARCVAACSV